MLLTLFQKMNYEIFLVCTIQQERVKLQEISDQLNCLCVLLY